MFENTILASPKQGTLSDRGEPHMRVGIYRRDGADYIHWRAERFDLSIEDAIALARPGSSERGDLARARLLEALIEAGMLAPELELPGV